MVHLPGARGSADTRKGLTGVLMETSGKLLRAVRSPVDGATMSWRSHLRLDLEASRSEGICSSPQLVSELVAK